MLIIDWEFIKSFFAHVYSTFLYNNFFLGFTCALTCAMTGIGIYTLEAMPAFWIVYFLACFLIFCLIIAFANFYSLTYSLGDANHKLSEAYDGLHERWLKACNLSETQKELYSKNPNTMLFSIVYQPTNEVKISTDEIQEAFEIAMLQIQSSKIKETLNTSNVNQ